ncbi:MAG: glycoside hydrolase family 3 N-terminal domain-containing protein [Pseudomonadota bacterium]
MQMTTATVFLASQLASLMLASQLITGVVLADDATTIVDSPAYRDATRAAQVRTADLLARMTLDEKLAQVSCIWLQKENILSADGSFSAQKMAASFPHGIGCIARPQDRVGLDAPGKRQARDASDTVQLVNAIQSHLLNDTRLGIPALFHEEGLHGYQARDATVFPQAIALASTWDPQLVERVYAIAAREIRARGAHHVLSPVVDVARDPRWGRIEETFGEDPLLVSAMGVAAVRGFQGTTLPLASNKVLTTLKHMTGHGEPESGMNVGPAHVSERTLREVFFPPFKAAIQQANAASVMASYNEIDGVPSHVSHFLLQDVLRNEWGFDGLVVSDYFAIDELVSRHGVAADALDASIQAMVAGIDLETPDPTAFPLLRDAVLDGRLPEAVLDRAVSNVLMAKFQATVFETPYADAEYAEAITGNASARELALDAARKAITLLKNNDNLLPLNAENISRIAVVGPNANETILGGYADVPRQAISVLAGMQARVGDSVRIDYAEGSRITEGRSWWDDPVTFVDSADNHKRIRKAVAVARKADVIVAVIGGNESTSREAWAEAHLGDRASLQLLGEQQALIEALVATGKPVVAVLIHGRPLAIPEVIDGAAAVLDGWILGQETGTAIAEVLFGDYNPGGKLPVSIPRSVGHLPVYYNHKPTSRRGYVDADTSALFPFGYGLSYTTFEFAAPAVDRKTLAWDTDIEVTIEVTNTGKRAGDEVVQVYLRDPVSSITRPVKALVAFRRIHIKAGQTQQVTLTVPFDALSFVGPDMKETIEAGDFELMVGADSQTHQRLTVTLPMREP